MRQRRPEEYKKWRVKKEVLGNPIDDSVILVF